MERLRVLSDRLTSILAELNEEAERLDVHDVRVPLAWLDEANGWLIYELAQLSKPQDERVPFTYIPVELRR